MGNQVKNKSKFICLAMLFIMTFTVLFSIGSNAYASSYDTTPDTDNSLKEKFDPYIQVQNNRYVLDLQNTIQTNSTEVEQIKQTIEYANEQIEANHGIIDPNTKIAAYLTFRVGGGYTYANFWWGTRYYFRSNNAVYQMDHDLDNYSIMSGSTALWAPPVGVLGAAYFQKVKSDLDYYSNTHLNDYINMDVNWAGIYSV
ncbi:hypothetical protein [Enterococcus faecalis]|uniref:hypothetical protein n=1 Tax=Enterococcus faecalis TaxID=1351 RepID=UPI004042E2A9